MAQAIHAVLSKSTPFDHGVITNMTRVHMVITPDAEHRVHSLFAPRGACTE
jgi:hypothetical protein